MDSYTSAEKAVRKKAAMVGGCECTLWHPVSPESKQPKGTGLKVGVRLGGAVRTRVNQNQKRSLLGGLAQSLGGKATGSTDV